MAIYKSFLAGLIALFFFISIVQAHDEKVMNVTGDIGRGAGFLDAKIDCGRECARRCSRASRAKICLRACGTCCARCNCVPPGTSGNANVCPCYANMTTHGGRKKCP